ncbi:DMT family transporter [Bacillus sp. NPDC077027]|uniref:DMT family transporter n=1 Tax=Bacillus sp. NPDC077027 TaxID=3390548 RepID=UPI003CFD025F
MKSITQKAYSAAILYACIIGLSFLFVKIALTSANPVDLLAHRFTVSFVAALLLYPFLRKKYRFSFHWRDLAIIAPLAIFYPILFFGFQVWGLTFTSSSEAGIIQASIPIFTMILASLFLKERSTWRQKAFTVLSVAGVVLLFVMNGIDMQASHMTGSLLIFLSALASSAYSVFARALTRRFHVFELTWIMTILGFVSFNLITLIQHSSNGTTSQFFMPFTDGSFIWAVLYLGIFSSLVTSFLSNYALSILEAAKMSSFTNLSAFITMAAGAIILHESIYAYHIFGALMIVVGVIGSNFSKQIKSV